jgi:hypothetical protein
MPTARYYLEIGVVNGILYAVGGNNATGVLATVEAYDPTTNTWTTMAPMPTARAALGGDVVGGLLYAVGGYYGAGIGLATNEAFTPAPHLPTTTAQCKDDGWQSYGVFKNQGDCVSSVATAGKNPFGKIGDK